MVVASVQTDEYWVKVFIAMATKQAETQEREVQRAQHLSWMSWLQEGPAVGFKRQHQLTKTKTGWVEPALIHDDADDQEVDDTSIIDGVSLEQLKPVAKPP